MNLADLGLGLAFLVLILAGARQGLVGILLLAAATLVSLVVAGVAAFWIAAEAGIPAATRLVAIPVVFFVTLWATGFLLRSLAQGVRDGAHRLPMASLDRLLGAAVAGAVGVLVLSVFVFGLVVVPFSNPVTREVKAAAASPWLLEAGARMTYALARPLPVLRPLAMRLEETSRRLKSRVETRATPPHRAPGARVPGARAA